MVITEVRDIREVDQAGCVWALCRAGNREIAEERSPRSGRRGAVAAGVGALVQI